MNTVYLSKLAGGPLIAYLRARGFDLHLLDGRHTPVYRQIATHADIHFCQLGLWEKARIFPGNRAALSAHYPGNISYNAACTGKYLIHNLKYTDPHLLAAARAYAGLYAKGAGDTEKAGDAKGALREIHVKQGYARCSCLPVTENAFITSDRGIARALEAYSNSDPCTHPLRVLLIREGHIHLPGFSHGFIGGCAGCLVVEGSRTVLFNGDLAAHPDYKNIAAFLQDCDVGLQFFPAYPLTDIGGILTGRLLTAGNSRQSGGAISADFKAPPRK